MNQLKKISLAILLLVIVVCCAEPTSYRQRFTARKVQALKQRPAVQQKRVLSRQEVVTPYPTADELKPGIPFEEGNIPDEVYGPPDEVYGPPDADQTPAEQLPSEEAPEEFAPNPDAEEFQPAEEIPSGAKQVSKLTRRRKANKKSIKSRLVQKKIPRSSQRLVVAPAQVIVAHTSAFPVTLPISSVYTSRSQQYYLSNQPYAYTAHFKLGKENNEKYPLYL